jgi:hypothetical protein
MEEDIMKKIALFIVAGIGYTSTQCSGSGSALIWLSWIRNPDPKKFTNKPHAKDF